MGDNKSGAPDPRGQRRTTPEADARIYPLVSDAGNERVLTDWLEKHDAYRSVDVDSPRHQEAFDLVIVDAAALQEHEADFRAAKDESAPILLPVLLLLPEKRGDVIETDQGDIADNVFQTTVDEIVSLPIRQTELEWRIRALLRLRAETKAGHRQTEELRRYKKAVESTGHAVYITEADGEITYVNEAFEELTGYTQEEAVGKTPRILQSGEMDEAYFDALWETITAGNIWAEEIVDERKDGSHYTAAQTIAPVLDDGEVEAYVAVQNDITDRKERESTLERRTRAIDEAPIGITISDPAQDDNPLIYVNDEFEAITGYSREESLGRNCRFLQGEKTDQDRVARIREAIDANEPISIDLRNYRADGTEFWNHLEIAPVRNEAGEVVNFIGFQQDVTDRRERKAALERQADLFEKVQEIADVGAWEYDVETGESRFSKQVKRMHDLDADETPSPETSLEQYHPEDRDRVRQAFERAVRTGEPYDVEARFIGPDGEQRWVRTQGEAQHADGELARVRGTLQDITDIKQRQMQLAVLDRVLRHNLRNAMNVVQGHASMIQSEGSASPASSADQIMETTDELLALSEKERQITRILQDKPSLEEIDLDRLVNMAVSTVAAEYPEASITLEGPDDLTTIAATNLETALLELLKNAIVHSDADSPDVEVSVSRSDDSIAIAVADNGPGIPEMERNVLIEETEQSQVYHGNGLGLWLVKLIVTRSAGTMSIDSRESGGTVVSLELPAVDT